MEQWWQLRFCVSLTPNLTDRPTTWRELGCGPGPLASHPEDWTLETLALEVLSGHHTRHQLGLAASTVDIVPLDVEGSMIQSTLLSFPVRSPQWSNVRSPGADAGAWVSYFWRKCSGDDLEFYWKYGEKMKRKKGWCVVSTALGIVMKLGTVEAINIGFRWILQFVFQKRTWN